MLQDVAHNKRKNVNNILGYSGVSKSHFRPSASLTGRHRLRLQCRGTLQRHAELPAPSGACPPVRCQFPMSRTSSGTVSWASSPLAEPVEVACAAGSPALDLRPAAVLSRGRASPRLPVITSSRQAKDVPWTMSNKNFLKCRKSVR